MQPLARATGGPGDDDRPHPRSWPRVVVLQDELPSYRLAFFQALASRHALDLTVVHSGSCSSGGDAPGFTTRTVRRVRVGPISAMIGVADAADQADVVVATCNPKQLDSLLLSRRQRTYKLILWAHHLGRSSVLARVRLAMIDRADAMVLYDAANVEEVVHKGVDAGKLFVVPNTIYVPNARLDRSVQRDSFLFVGRLKRRKGVDVFLREFAVVRADKDLPIYATIIGSGPEQKRLAGLASDLGIQDRVRFVPGTSDPEVLFSEFRRAIAYVSPLHVGLGVLHSFSYGVPVITLRERRHAPEINNCVHGENSLLCDDQFTVSDAMQLLVDQQHLSFEMGERGHEHYIMHRRIDQMADAMARVIRLVSGGQIGCRTVAA